MSGSGKFRDKIEVQVQDDTQDAYGGQDGSYTTQFSARCDFKILTGGESIKIGLETSTVIASIMMRYDKRLREDHLILWKGERYSIQFIKPTERKNQMVVTVSRQL